MSRRQVSNRFPIAIVGIGCRYPGRVDGPDSYLELLMNKVDAISEIPAERWNLEKFFSANPKVAGKSYSKWGGFLENIDLFDPECFAISPREAEFMDPQQRLILETALDALFDGGQRLEDFSGSNTGVFVGLSSNDYAQVQAGIDERQQVAPHSVTGNALCVVANRVSYTFNLSGPSLVVDTACSSSLVATHLACHSIWNRECEAAFAGGVNLILLPNAFISFCAATMLSPDGRCKAFDASANGFVRGEGAGMVLLKPLDRALAANDPIYGVIKGTAVNHDGRTAGLPLPGKEAQKALIETAYREAGLDRKDVFYIEAHGTGTAIGDPVEANALGEMFGALRTANDKCLIGSVKTNIGHLEGGAGVASLIKAALCVKNRTIPPSLHFTTPNPQIAFSECNLEVVTAAIPYPEERQAEMMIGVNAFGIGGANAHVIVSEFREEVPGQPTVEEPGERMYLLPLSAPDDDGLQILARNYVDFLDRHPQTSLADICYSASRRRSHYQRRLALAGKNREALKEQLSAFLAGESRPGMAHRDRRRGAKHKLVFVISGQGPQWWAMGRQLLQEESVFRAVVKECDHLFKAHADWSLWDELTADEENSRVSETAISQPLLFTLQVALAALWRAQGVEPAAVVGHSVGEVAAAYLAGAFDLATALKVIYYRGHCMNHAIIGDAMAAVGVGPAKARELISPFADRVTISAFNSPTSVTLSGDEESLRKIGDQVNAEGIFFRFLVVQYAFHSASMEPVQAPLSRALREIPLTPLKLPIYSTVTGERVGENCFDAAYWWRNVREKVSFGPAITNLLGDEFDTFVEIGPHPVLATSILECAAGRDIVVLPSLRRRADERLVFFGSLGNLYGAGYPLDWSRISAPQSRFCKLPGYPWQRQSYWHESAGWAEQRLGKIVHPLLYSRTDAADPGWNTLLDTSLLAYLKDHCVRQKIVFPGAGYIEMALAAGHQLQPDQPLLLENLQFQKALFLSTWSFPTIQFSFSREDSSFTIRSAANPRAENWNTHAFGYLRSRPLPIPDSDLENLRQEICEPVAIDQFYKSFAPLGLDYGPLFRGVSRLWQAFGQSLAEVALPAALKADSGAYLFHPALLDACIQTVFQATSGAFAEDFPPTLFLPVAVSQVRFYRPMAETVWVHSRMRITNPKVLVGDLRIYAAEGDLLLELIGFRCQAVELGGPVEVCNEFHYVWCQQSILKAAPSRPALDYFNDPPRFVETLHDEAVAAAAPFGGNAGVNIIYQQLDQIARGYIGKALGDFGCSFSPQDYRLVAEWGGEFGVRPLYHALLEKFFQALVSSGQAEQNQAGEWALPVAPAIDQLEELERAVRLNFSSAFAELSLLRIFGRRLAAVMRGEQDPLSLLFPAGSTAGVESFYLDSLSFRGCNQVVQKAVEGLCQALPEGRSLRILEVGAGTGGLTTNLLRVLPAEKVEYWYTDISNFFFTRAKQKFGDYPFIHYQELNLEEGIAEQGFLPQSFDLILASDVLHATRDLRESLTHLRELLVDRGVLLFIDIDPDREILWMDMIFGLIEGWWRFADKKLRVDSPLLSRDCWLSLLGKCGFSDPVAISQFPGDRQFGHLVLMARNRQVAASVTPVVPPVVDDDRHKPATWLLFADPSPVSRELLELLQASDDTVVTVRPGLAFELEAEGGYRIDPGNHETMDRLFDELDVSAGLQVVDLLSLACPELSKEGLSGLSQSEKLGSHTLIVLLSSLQKRSQLSCLKRLFIVTQGAQPLAAGVDVALNQSQIIGLARVIQNEHPEIYCTCIDLDPKIPNPAALYAELLSKSPEEEVVLRHGGRYVPRLRQVAERYAQFSWETGKELPPFNLQVSGAGSIDNLRLQAFAVPVLEPDEVEITVRAAALNFRDLMKTLGLYPSENGADWQLGDECAGIITAIGAGVRDFQIGDEVITIAAGCLGSRVISKARYLVVKPVHISFAEAVTIPIVFLTVYYALYHLAGIKKGDRILVQAAAGGVGLAAIQVAQQVGAEVLATAGSPEKRDLLRALGVKTVMDSRTLAFADEVMASTEGRGVDIVLNSLAGEALAKSVECLAPYGRFLELGKIDIYKNSKLGLHSLRHNISFHAIDLSSMLVDDSTLPVSLLRRIFTDLEALTIHPLPHRIFPVSRLKEAFRTMAQGRHIGKLVISFQDSWIPVYPLPAPPVPLFSEQASYLITGGFGGFGLVMANWICEQGGKYLILASRRGATTPAAQQAVRELEEKGAEVMAVAVDVSDAAQVDDLVACINQEMPVLRGIFHAAMVIDDGIVSQLNPERFNRVNDPKVKGCWNLHRASSSLALDYFVLFSSFSALVGNPGQGSYVAANVFLDTFAAYRRALGLPAIAINWGVLGEVGFVARNQPVSEYLERKGLVTISPAEAMRILGRILRQDPQQTGPAAIDWQAWGRSYHNRGIPPRFSELIEESDLAHAQSGDGRMIRELIIQAAAEKRGELMHNYLREQIAAVLQVAAAKLQVDQPLNELGMDSLMMVELNVRIENDLSMPLPTAQIRRNPSLAELADILLNTMFGSADKTTLPTSAPVAQSETATGFAEECDPECLVPLRSKGSRPILFCFHPTGGEAGVYRSLTSLLPVDQPVYGIQSRVLGGRENEYDSFVRMAQAYTRLLRSQQPRGPYYLLGFSSGGLLALTVAHLLMEEGEKVAFCALIDCEAAVSDSSIQEKMRDHYIGEMFNLLTETFAARLKLAAGRRDEDRQALVALVKKHQQENYEERLCQWLWEHRYLNSEMELVVARNYFGLVRRHLVLLLEFKPLPTDTNLVIWTAVQGLVQSEDNNFRLSRLNSGPVETITLPGDHYGLLTFPGVEVLAKQLENKLYRLMHA